MCMNELMRVNRANATLVAEIGVKYANKIDTKKTIQVLEQYGSNEGLLLFLCNVLPQTDDPDIYFKYIEACARLVTLKKLKEWLRKQLFTNQSALKISLWKANFRTLVHLFTFVTCMGTLRTWQDICIRPSNWNALKFTSSKLTQMQLPKSWVHFRILTATRFILNSF